MKAQKVFVSSERMHRAHETFKTDFTSGRRFKRNAANPAIRITETASQRKCATVNIKDSVFLPRAGMIVSVYT